MSYTLSQCLEDVGRKRGSLVSGQKDGYRQVWDCMNRYATSCLAAKKGINIQNFCKIGYTMESSVAGGRTKYRPYFQLAEAFCKNYAIESKNTKFTTSEKELSAFEEFNFSKAAIKFSNNLSKDNVFSGLKYIIQAFGESMSSGKKVEIEFECGKLTAIDRKWSFVFKGEVYSREGLQVPNNASLAESAYAPSNAFQVPSQSEMKSKLQTSRSAAASPGPSSRCGPVSSSRGGRAASPDYAESEVAFSENGGDYQMELNVNQPKAALNAQNLAQIPENSEVRERDINDWEESRSATTASEHEVYDPAKYKGPTVKQEKAHREAMDRYLTEMEIRASEAIADRRQWEEHLDRCLRQERNDLDRKRALCSENSEFIQQQIEWNKIRNNHDRKNYIAAASAHEFPTFTEPDDAGLRKLMKERQVQMRKDLNLQVRTNNALKTIERNKEREMEYAQLVANKNELATQSRKEEKARAFEKALLTDSWARECRMRNINRAIENHGSAANMPGGGDAGEELMSVLTQKGPVNEAKKSYSYDDDNVSTASSQGFRTRGPVKLGAAKSLAEQRKAAAMKRK